VWGLLKTRGDSVFGGFEDSNPQRIADALAARGATRYNFRMIRSFRHKGVERFFKSGSRAGIQAAHAPRLARQLSALDAASFAFENGDAVLVDYQDYH